MNSASWLGWWSEMGYALLGIKFTLGVCCTLSLVVRSSRLFVTYYGGTVLLVVYVRPYGSNSWLLEPPPKRGLHVLLLRIWPAALRLRSQNTTTNLLSRSLQRNSYCEYSHFTILLQYSIFCLPSYFCSTLEPLPYRRRHRHPRRAFSNPRSNLSSDVTARTGGASSYTRRISKLQPAYLVIKSIPTPVPAWYPASLWLISCAVIHIHIRI